MINDQIQRIIVLFLLTISLSGCFSSNPADISKFIKPTDANTTADKYILQPNDNIIVRCSKIETIHESIQIIRPDGKVSFEGIGEVQAAGKTPAQLSEGIRLKLLEFYQLSDNKPVDVQITAYKSNHYYILGQVDYPGPKPYSGRDNISKVISLARPNPMAWMERVQVIRPSSDKNTKPAIFELNYDRMMAHGDYTKDFLLESGDIIYVPPTVLGWIALKVEEVVRPIARAFSGLYTVRRGLSDTDNYNSRNDGWIEQ